MFSEILWRYQRVDKRMTIFAFWLLGFLKLVSDVLRRQNVLDVKRFYAANKLRVSDNMQKELANDQINIGLIVVSSNKDFELLPFSLPAAVRALGNLYSGTTRIITPQSDIATCANLIRHSCIEGVQIISEEKLIEKKYRAALKSKFKGRYGWALQQFLKVSAVTQSEFEHNLIIDADTILIQPRKWIDAIGRQAIFPSWEYNPSYYKLLHEMGISDTNPEYTFVSHHMCMKKEHLVNAIRTAGFDDMEHLLEFVVENANDEESPFCIEYELYAQYLFNFQKNNIFLEKWANRGVSRKVILESSLDDLLVRYSKYASISAHDYLT